MPEPFLLRSQNSLRVSALLYAHLGERGTHVLPQAPPRRRTKSTQGTGLEHEKASDAMRKLLWILLIGAAIGTQAGCDHNDGPVAPPSVAGTTVEYGFVYEEVWTDGDWVSYVYEWTTY